MCTSPVTYRSKAAALRALWLLASEEQVHVEYDRRFRALVLPAWAPSWRPGAERPDGDDDDGAEGALVLA